MEGCSSSIIDRVTFLTQKLLEMVPHLQERLTESSELEEYMTIADSVRLQFENSQIYAYRLPLDSKGRLKRKIG